MAFGLQVFRADGTPELDISDRLTRHIYTRDLPADESNSVTLPNFDSTKGFAVAVLTDPASTFLTPHQITASGHTISWAPIAEPAVYRGNSQLQVFSYA